jgi:hypothetical protein
LDKKKEALGLALAGRAELVSLAPGRQALYGLSRLGCLACHKRDGVGGVPAALDPLFTTLLPIDLGDEGRLPPPLDGAGSKFKPGAFERIVLAGELHVRPYTATRMPTFVADAALGQLVAALAQADGRPDDQSVPKFSQDVVKAGRRLIGTAPEPAQSGLGCINCHNLSGFRSPGIPGVDLATAPERLNPSWFRQWLANPTALRDGTRMPAFWGEEKIFAEIEGGDPERQQSALWAYLSLGQSLPMPLGLQADDSAKELVPVDRPIIYRTYAKDAGPRAIVVGHPERVHVAFDANVVRLAQAWRGKFWDPSGTWTGRAGKFNAPLGTDVVDMPPGPAFAYLAGPSDPWPAVERTARNAGGRFRGYRLNGQGQPSFAYRLDGVDITELPRPVVSAEGAVLVRQFTVGARGRRPGLHFMAATGKSIEPQGQGVWKVDGARLVRLKSALPAVVRDSAGRRELLVAVPPKTTSFEVELQW